MKTSLLIVSISFLLLSCSDQYEQQYANYEAYATTNLRNKSWFPEAITPITFDLRCVSFLDSLCAFGSYSYSYDAYRDSIMNDAGTIKIPFSEFESKVQLHKERKPDWFLNCDSTPNGIFQSFRMDRFYITFDVANNKVYYILCD